MSYHQPSSIFEENMLRQSNIILLWNVGAMFFIAFSTDYWQYDTYRFEDMLQQLGNQTWTKSRRFYKWQHLIVLQVALPGSACAVNGPPPRLQESTTSPTLPGALGLDADAASFSSDSQTCEKSVYLFMEYRNLFRVCNELQGWLRWFFGCRLYRFWVNSAARHGMLCWGPGVGAVGLVCFGRRPSYF